MIERNSESDSESIFVEAEGIVTPENSDTAVDAAAPEGSDASDATVQQAVESETPKVLGIHATGRLSKIAGPEASGELIRTPVPERHNAALNKFFEEIPVGIMRGAFVEEEHEILGLSVTHLAADGQHPEALHVIVHEDDGMPREDIVLTPSMQDAETDGRKSLRWEYEGKRGILSNFSTNVLVERHLQDILKYLSLPIKKDNQVVGDVQPVLIEGGLSAENAKAALLVLYRTINQRAREVAANT